MSVSIPYGTIKTKCDLCRDRKAREVSIPYGTIKTSVEAKYSYHARVSIPYGTIKTPTFYLSSRRNGFQFHTVQLKHGLPARTSG